MISIFYFIYLFYFILFKNTSSLWSVFICFRYLIFIVLEFILFCLLEKDLLLMLNFNF